MAKAIGVAARMFTWEVVTGFGSGALSQETLEDFFRRDFPTIQKMPRFWKMVSFNSAEGRRHRYLVILADGDMAGGRERQVPRSLSLFAVADREMRKSCTSGNFCFAAMAGNCLYVLVFFEGRLCHWSEEYGYDGADFMGMGLERLERFNCFLKTDALFSQAEVFERNGLKVLEMDFGNPRGPWRRDFLSAVRDPFWRGLRLEAKRRWRIPALSIILLLLVMVACFLGWLGQDVGLYGEQALKNPEPPALTSPATKHVLNESNPETKKRILRTTSGKAVSGSSCSKPSLEIKGLVGNRLFSGVAGGVSVVKRAGDSLGLFYVKTVLRDRVVLECGGREWEVINGIAP